MPFPPPSPAPSRMARMPLAHSATFLFPYAPAMLGRAAICGSGAAPGGRSEPTTSESLRLQGGQLMGALGCHALCRRFPSRACAMANYRRPASPPGPAIACAHVRCPGPGSDPEPDQEPTSLRDRGQWLHHCGAHINRKAHSFRQSVRSRYESYICASTLPALASELSQSPG